LSIDLHIHSTASDGTRTPLEILASARRIGLTAIAITDHDTLAGSRELLESPALVDIKALSGVEISAAPPPLCPQRGSFHILGYGIAFDHPPLNRALERLQNARRERNPKIIQLGIGTGDLAVPDALYVKLTEALSAQHPRVAVARG
jgi:hypothetical protein